MQKKLIALAVAGVFAAPAFAATSNVDVYGQMDFSVNWVNSDNSVAGSDDSDLVTAKSNASRIGFKGSEDLGGGLAALWQIETGFLQNSDNSFGAGFSGGYDSGFRNTFVGLKSASLGTVLLGRHDTPYKLATGKLDIFSDNIGDYNAIIGSRSTKFGSDGGLDGFDLRAPQTLAYITPTFGGFHAAAAYVGAKVAEAAGQKETDAYSLMGMYDNGPLFASLAYERHNNVGAAPANGKADGTKVGLGYKFGNASIGGVYEKTSQTGNGVWDRSAWWLGGSYGMGNIVLKAAYGTRGDSKAGATKDGGDMYAIGADYLLSKRTKAYITYAKASDDANGDVVLLGQSATGVNNDPSTLSIGVRHSF